MAEFVFVKALPGRVPMDMTRREPFPTDCWRRVERDGRLDRLATKYGDVEMRTEAPPDSEIEGYEPPSAMASAAAEPAAASEEADQTISARRK